MLNVVSTEFVIQQTATNINIFTVLATASQSNSQVNMR